jgi:two-component system OmpR family response regulator
MAARVAGGETAIAPSESTVPEATPPKAFIVEDSAVIRLELVLTLQELAAVQVVGAVATQQEAIERLSDPTLQCDLAIVDVVLQDGTGFAVLAEPRVHREGRRFVVLTNYASAAVRRRCVDLGAQRVFDKSNEIDELLAYCKELSESARSSARST